MSEAIDRYRQVLGDRRQGVKSSLGSGTPFTRVKPEYYADSRLLIRDALRVFKSFRQTHPPYGLVDAQGNAFSVKPGEDPWMQLTYALKFSGRAAMDRAVAPIESCPYHEVLASKLGGTAVALTPQDNNERGIDTLRSVATPAAELNAPVFTALVRRLPAIQRLHGSSTNPASFARNSVGLLDEPLNHPQQWAKAFAYSLGSLDEIISGDGFLDDEVAREFTRVVQRPHHGEALEWAQPTENLTLRQAVDVPSRVLDSELSPITSSSVTMYPVGTRLGDIRVDEPTIGCPGNQLAYTMWNRAIDVAAGEGLWQAT